jgi:hypothetical protein
VGVDVPPAPLVLPGELGWPSAGFATVIRSSFAGGVDPWSSVRGVAPLGRGGMGGGGPRGMVMPAGVVVRVALGSCGGWNASPKGVGCVPRVEGPALPLGGEAAGAASSGRLGASGGVVQVALGDVSLWDVIPMGSEGGGGDPGRGGAILLAELAAGWATPSRCGDLGGVFQGGLGPPETRGDGGSGLGAAGREVVKVGPGGMVVPRYLGTGDGEGLGDVDPASLGAVGHAQAGESGPEVVG